MTTLVRERNNSLIERFIRPVKTITYQAEVNEIINLFADNEHHKVVVLDHDSSVLGVIYADDALSLFGKLPAESLYNIAGVDENERPFDSIYKKFTNGKTFSLIPFDSLPITIIPSLMVSSVFISVPSSVAA